MPNPKASLNSGFEEPIEQQSKLPDEVWKKIIDLQAWVDEYQDFALEIEKLRTQIAVIQERQLFIAVKIKEITGEKMPSCRVVTGKYDCVVSVTPRITGSVVQVSSLHDVADFLEGEV